MSKIEFASLVTLAFMAGSSSGDVYEGIVVEVTAYALKIQQGAVKS